MWETTLAVLQFLLPLLPGGLWCAWWLWCVNWKKAWPILSEGGWIVVVLMMFITAMSWSAIFPRSCNCLGVPLANFWWQLGAVTTLTVIALFCGWIQDRLNWTPAEVSFEPPEASHHHHGHHGHH